MQRQVLHVFPTFGFGGVPIRIASILNLLGRQYRHRLIALDGCFDARKRLAGEIDIEFEAFEGDGRGWVGRLGSMRRHLREVRPDLLLTYNWGSIEWAFANGLRSPCPHVHFESGFGVEEADRLLLRRTLFRRLALARADRLVVPSHVLADIARNVWKIDRRKVQIIPNGVDCERFSAEAGTTRPGPLRGHPTERIVGTIAPLRPEKNIARLLRAFARLDPKSDVSLLIVGDGPERPRLAALSQELGISDRTRFAGHQDQVEGILPTLDVFTLTSDTEQLPNSLLQAMAAARAVAAVDVGDVRRVLSPENRELVVRKDDEAALAGVLDRLLADPGLRAHLGQANQDHVRWYYPLEGMYAEYLALFDSVSERSPSVTLRGFEAATAAEQ